MHDNSNNIFSIGTRIKELRTERGMTQAELSTELNIARSTVSQWESGLRVIGLEDAVRVANYFNVSCDKLIRGIDTDNLMYHFDTGLSNDAIERLKEYNQHFCNQLWNDDSRYQPANTLDFISALITDDDFWIVLEKYIECTPAFSSSPCEFEIDTDKGKINLNSDVIKEALLQKLIQRIKVIFKEES